MLQFSVLTFIEYLKKNIFFRGKEAEYSEEEESDTEEYKENRHKVFIPCLYLISEMKMFKNLSFSFRSTL